MILLRKYYIEMLLGGGGWDHVGTRKRILAFVYSLGRNHDISLKIFSYM